MKRKNQKKRKNGHKKIQKGRAWISVCTQTAVKPVLTAEQAEALTADGLGGVYVAHGYICTQPGGSGLTLSQPEPSWQHFLSPVRGPVRPCEHWDKKPSPNTSPHHSFCDKTETGTWDKSIPQVRGQLTAEHCCSCPQGGPGTAEMVTEPARGCCCSL